jgi:hypothetical protein
LAISKDISKIVLLAMLSTLNMMMLSKGNLDLRVNISKIKEKE